MRPQSCSGYLSSLFGAQGVSGVNIYSMFVAVHTTKPPTEFQSRRTVRLQKISTLERFRNGHWETSRLT
jgi:hypothetical protein